MPLAQSALGGAPSAAQARRGTQPVGRSSAQEDASLSDHRASSGHDDPQGSDTSNTDSTGNHRHLEATPARALSSQGQRWLANARQNNQHMHPFSTVPLDGIDISHAVHWLANRQVRAPSGSAPRMNSSHIPTSNAFPTEHEGLPLSDQKQQPLHQTAARAPRATEINPAPTVARNLDLPFSDAIAAQRVANVPAPIPRFAAQAAGRAPVRAEAVMPIPLPELAPAPTVTSARLPDISGLTSAMGTPARFPNAFHHIPIDKDYPGPRHADVPQYAQSTPLGPSHAQVRGQAKSHTVSLNLRAHVQTDEDSDSSATGESESVDEHLPARERQANHGLFATEGAACGGLHATVSTSAASDSHPRPWLETAKQRKATQPELVHQAIDDAAVGVAGPLPPTAAPPAERNVDRHHQEGLEPLVGAGIRPTTSADSTSKLQHMHEELAKIVDRLGRLEAEKGRGQSQDRNTPRQYSGRPANIDGSSSGEEGTQATLSRATIKNMQAHMRELMREMQRQRRALGDIVELEQGSVEDHRKMIQEQPGSATPNANMPDGRQGRAKATKQPELALPPRRLLSPSKAVRQRQVRSERNDQLLDERAPNLWTGDANVLHDEMDNVLHHVHLLRDEVDRGMHPASSRHRFPHGTSHAAVQDEQLSSPYVRRNADAGHARATQSSPTPVQQHFGRGDGGADQNDASDISMLAAERAAEALAKVRQFSQHQQPGQAALLNRHGRSAFGLRHTHPVQAAENVASTRRSLAAELDALPNQRVGSRQEDQDEGQAEFEHDDDNCYVCRASAEAQKQRTARRDRVKKKDRDQRRGAQTSAHRSADTEEEEVLIDMLVEEAERQRARQQQGRNARSTTRAATEASQNEEVDPISSWKDLIILSSAQQASLRRMVKEHFDEFIHQRMLYAELADELKGVHPAMNAVRRRILGEHVMEAVELLEIKAERINVLQRLLGQEAHPDDVGKERGTDNTVGRNAAGAYARPRERPRSKAAQTKSKLRHEVEVEEDLTSEYSEAEDPREEDNNLHAAAAALRGQQASSVPSRRHRHGSTSPDEHPRPMSANSQARSNGYEDRASGSSSASGRRTTSRGPGEVRSAQPKQRRQDYSPPTTIGARELAVDMSQRDDVSELGSDAELGEEDDDEEEQRRGSLGRSVFRPASQQRKNPFGVGAEGRPAKPSRGVGGLGSGSGSTTGYARNGRRSRP